MLVSIGQAAAVIGVSVSSLRRWEKEGQLLPATRTKGGHRRYRLSEIERQFFGEPSQERRRTIAYARVSSSDQHLDLQRQIRSLTRFCKGTGRPFTVISDLGSGLNYNKRGLTELVKAICSGQVEYLVITHRDRLLRFGAPLLFKLCEFHDTKVVVLNDLQAKTFEEELVGDVLEMMTVFCAKVHGRRSHEHCSRKTVA